MIEFVGPNYTYQGEKLDHPEVIYVRDHHYNEDLQCYPVEQLLSNSTCDPTSHTIVFDHVLQHDDNLKQYNCIFLPLFMAISEAQFNAKNIQPSWNNKYKTFSFMINKPRMHREFLLRLIEHFKLDNYAYTLCWKTVNEQMSTIKNPKYRYLEQPVSIDPYQHLMGHEELLDRGLRYKHITNVENYLAFLKDHVFEPSCISLITEPAFYERETIITEKTIMAVWGGNIPIWVGGWRIPEYLQHQGFDIFDDLVDHSYQALDDPWDRCYYAIEHNLALFKEVDKLQNFVYNNKSRFEHNLNILRQGYFQTAVKQMVNKSNTEVQRHFAKIC